MNSARKDSAVIRYILIAVAVVAVAALAWKVVDVFIIAFGGIVMATVLRAASEPLARRTGWSERWTLLLVIVALLAGFGLLAWMFGAQAANQFAELRERLPQAAEKLRNWLEGSRAGKAVVDSIKQALGSDKTASGVGVAAGAMLGGIGNVLLILFAGIYFAASPKLYRNGLLRLFPTGRRPEVAEAMGEAGCALRKWLVAQLLIMVAVGTLTGVSLAVIGVPLSLSLGVLAGLLEFVPVVGPIAAAVPGLLLAFAKDPRIGLYALAVYIVVQQVESNVITPLTQRWAVELPPVLALLAIVAGGLLFGILGVVFATPLAVVTMVLVRKLYVEDALEKGNGAAVAARAAR